MSTTLISKQKIKWQKKENYRPISLININIEILNKYQQTKFNKYITKIDLFAKEKHQYAK